MSVRTTTPLRRRAVGIFAAAAMAVTAVALPSPAAANQPNVNVERVILAAQLDPHKPGTGITSGARDGVIRVERVLRDKGLLAGRRVDGHFGSSTQATWRQWERRLGVRAVNRNGLPSPYELRKLVGNRFDVVKKFSIGKVVTVNNPRGSHRVAQRTLAMLGRAERRGGDMTITQGSYSNGSNSAGTHLGGGVIDLSARTRSGSRLFTNAEMRRRVDALQRVGFAAWFRNWSGNRHIHAVADNDYQLSNAAHDGLCQVHEHRFGGDGLSCNNGNSGSNQTLRWWESFKRNH